MTPNEPQRAPMDKTLYLHEPFDSALGSYPEKLLEDYLNRNQPVDYKIISATSKRIEIIAEYPASFVQDQNEPHEQLNDGEDSISKVFTVDRIIEAKMILMLDEIASQIGDHRNSADYGDKLAKLAEEILCKLGPNCNSTGTIDISSLKLARKGLGLTQQEIADALGVQRTQVTNIESGKSNITSDKVRPWARLLNMTTDDFLKALHGEQS